MIFQRYLQTTVGIEADTYLSLHVYEKPLASYGDINQKRFTCLVGHPSAMHVRERSSAMQSGPCSSATSDQEPFHSVKP